MPSIRFMADITATRNQGELIDSLRAQLAPERIILLAGAPFSERFRNQTRRRCVVVRAATKRDRVLPQRRWQIHSQVGRLYLAGQGIGRRLYPATCSGEEDHECPQEQGGRVYPLVGRHGWQAEGVEQGAI
jgi:hypothetical protein